MKKALLIWGGWDGHKPLEVADRIGAELEKRNYEVTKTSHFGCLLNEEELYSYDVIVPIWSCGIKSDIYLNELADAIKSGIGLATFHGGINWFDQDEYYRIIGGFYLHDTKCESYEVVIANKDHIITKGQSDFEIYNEKYFLQVDPTNDILASANFSGIEMPIAWTRSYGKGQVFYTTFAHQPEDLFGNNSLEMLLNGIEWCTRK
jgi:type 1 glutamine amidotransferase